MSACSCGCDAAPGLSAHAIARALDDFDMDRALTLGLLDVAECTACSATCTARLLAARQDRRAALAARDRFRARALRLERRAAERAARRQAPASPGVGKAPPLPQAAADALARALAKAGPRR